RRVRSARASAAGARVPGLRQRRRREVDDELLFFRSIGRPQPRRQTRREEAAGGAEARSRRLSTGSRAQAPRRLGLGTLPLTADSGFGSRDSGFSGSGIRDQGSEPCYRQRMLVVLFRSKLVPEPDGYAEMAQEMAALAASMPGFVDVKAYTSEDGERLTVVWWE